ncbi:MAG: hypothetical protein M3077_05560 [Candidatus Dormibacteraeota bacterium]|nr:hypothetical protein [Candidatus Dormibacteraeota bacterium]
MGNVIPWSQIHPSIKSEQPFVGVIMVDPEGKLCISELVHLDQESMASPSEVASRIVAAAQQAGALVASGYRAHRQQPARAPHAPRTRRGLHLLKGGLS